MSFANLRLLILYPWTDIPVPLSLNESITLSRYEMNIVGDIGRGAATDSGPPGQHFHSGPPFGGGGGILNAGAEGVLDQWQGELGN